MRLATAGKGGSGKTTIAATLARVFGREGYPVTALEDDPNPNLASALGLSPEQIDQLQRVPRDEILEERVDGEGTASLHLTRPFGSVLDQYAVRGPDNVLVMRMTGLLGAGQG